MGRNMMSNHTDMQDKYCGACYDMHIIHIQCTKGAVVNPHLSCGSFVLALSRVNIRAASTLFVLHVGVIGHHVHLY